jgi:NADH-quinone oxidoreductase subunit J
MSAVTLYLFYFLSFVAIFSALLVVFSKNAVYSVLYLIITLFSIAGHYVLLNAQFLAAVHVIVYAGAIMVLFLYVIMLLDLNEAVESQKSTLQKMAAIISAGVLMILMIGALKGAQAVVGDTIAPNEIGLVKNLGKILFTDYLLPFEITSILLLAAMVGAVMLGKPEKQKSKENA